MSQQGTRSRGSAILELACSTAQNWGFLLKTGESLGKLLKVKSRNLKGHSGSCKEGELTEDEECKTQTEKSLRRLS